MCMRFFSAFGSLRVNAVGDDTRPTNADLADRRLRHAAEQHLWTRDKNAVLVAVARAQVANRRSEVFPHSDPDGEDTLRICLETHFKHGQIGERIAANEDCSVAQVAFAMFNKQANAVALIEDVAGL